MPDDAIKHVIGRIVAGGEDAKVAFKELYDRYQRQVFTVCYRLTGDYHRATEATQESFFAVYRGLESFNFRSSFKTWLFQVTKNTALQQLRKASSRSHLSLDEREEGGERPGGTWEAANSGGPGQLESLIEDEFERDLQAALGRLTQRHREILTWRYFGDCSYEELAGLLGCSIGTVKSRLSRAHRALKPFMLEVLKKHGRLPAGGRLPERSREVP